MKPELIALTGFIGSGKSTVCSILREWGYKTVDCDEIARQIASRPEVVEQAAKLLGKEFVSDGQLNRAAIRAIVFDDGELLAKYQKLFFAGVRKCLEEIASRTQSVLFVEIQVFDAFCFPWNEVWQVRCNEDVLLGRVRLRDGENSRVEAILARQRQIQPTRVIVNNGDLEDLHAAVKAALVGAGLQK